MSLSPICRSDMYVKLIMWRIEQFAVDLYLVHTAMPIAKRLETWKAMEEILKSGKAKAIGVSNYGVHHLKELFAHCTIRPSVNQVLCSQPTNEATN